MSKTWIVMDVHNMAYRHWFVHQAAGRAYAIIAGLLKDMRTYQARWPGAGLVFCTDCEPYLRREIRPLYKTAPRNEEARAAVRAQARIFMEDVLPGMGFQNLFSVEGAEADDLIANVVHSNSGDRHVLVSSDQDLYQLLHDGRVEILSPVKKTVFTEEDLRRIHDVMPSEWPLFKAIIGCTSDQIDGVTGIGPNYATAYIRERLKTSGLRWEMIRDSRDWIEENVRLIRLPYEPLNLEPVQLKEDNVPSEAWDMAAAKYGFQGARRNG